MKGQLIFKNLRVQIEQYIVFILKGTKWEDSKEAVCDVQVPYFLVIGSF